MRDKKNARQKYPEQQDSALNDAHPIGWLPASSFLVSKVARRLRWFGGARSLLALWLSLGFLHTANAAFPANVPGYWAQSFVSLGVEFPRPENPLPTADGACERTRAQGEFYMGNYGPVTKSVNGLMCTINYYGWSYGITPPGPVPAAKQYLIRVTSECPSTSDLSGSTCVCKSGYQQNAGSDGCYQNETVDIVRVCKTGKCGFGNPIYPLTGSKKETVETGISVGGHSLALTYDSARQTAAAAAGILAKDFGDLPSFGALWFSSLHRKLVISPAGFGVKLFRGNGQVISFRYQAGGYVSDADISDQLTSITGGYRIIDTGNKRVETYSTSGQLTSLADAAGNTLYFSYSAEATGTTPAAGYLMQVTDNNGRSVSFEYTLPAGGLAATDGRVSKIVNATGRVITPAYDSNGNLASLTWEDGGVRQFRYENPSHTSALTGVVDENNSRLSTFGYDSIGRAISTERSGGVNKFGVSYATPPAIAITEVYDSAAQITYRYHDWQAPAGVDMATPNGQTVSLGATSIAGNPLITGLSQPAGSGCTASNSGSTYDTNGNLLSQDDFQGQRTCYAYDSSNREITRIEGLVNSVACSTVTPSGVTLPTGARKITTTWHPDWRLPALVNEPTRRTTTIYQGQPDSFNSNAIANCTSATNLPNGKPMPLVCKQVVQANKENVTVGYGQDATANSVSLYLQADGSHGSVTFMDSSVRAKPVTTSGTAYISTSQSAVGGSSAYFDGATAFLSISQNAEFEMGSGDYSVEAWVNPSEKRDAAIVFKGRSRYSYYGYWDSGFGIRTSSGGSISFYFNTNYMNPPEVVLSYAPGIPLNQWSHVAMVVKNGTGYAFINGVLVGTKGGVGAIPTSTEGVYVGLMPTNVNTSLFKGYIDDVRITKGVARYISSFTPPALTNIDTAVPAVTTSYTYDAAGRVLSKVDPNGKTTSYAYYAATSFTGVDPNAIGNTVGDLQSITNAAGHVTQYTQYDRAGRVRQTIDPKGVVTDISYTPRGWVSTVTTTASGVAGRTTTYTYDNVGQLTGLAQADGATLSYSYDAAHRLVGVTDAKGNSVTYTLDNVGNRIAEDIKDPTGTLQRSISRSFDALNRVQQVTGSSR